MTGDLGTSTIVDVLWAELAQAQRRLTPRALEGGVTEAELGRALCGAAMYGYLQRVCADPDHPAFLPGPGYHVCTGTPNPDTVYLTAAVDGAGEYRITGRRGTVPELTLMPMGPPTRTGVVTYPSVDLGVLAAGDGSVDVVLSGERPAGRSGAWLPIAPDVTTLMVRSVSDDWGRHEEPALAITRLDVPARRRRTDPDHLAARLAAVTAVASASIGYGLRKVEALRDEGRVNDVALVDYSANGGVAAQWYHEGVFDLRRGEQLLIEAHVGHQSGYFSLSLTDAMFCTLDWVNAQSSLNRTQARVDDDGVLRAVLAADDPGIDNWLDTTGHLVGVLQLRWAGLATAPEVSVTAVAADDLRRRLPVHAFIGPEERATALRDRSRRAQVRALW